jgi:hypothetical protein
MATSKGAGVLEVAADAEVEAASSKAQLAMSRFKAGLLWCAFDGIRFCNVT